MSVFEEIRDLFASLALNLKSADSATDNGDSSIDLTISKFSQSLNLEEQSRVRVLDTALSLMCFTAPQVLDSLVEYYVKTIVTVLTSSIHCKLIRFGKEEILRIGGSISSLDVVEVMGACGDVLGKLDGHGGSQEFTGMLSWSLLDSVLRVAASASCSRHLVRVAPTLVVNRVDETSLALRKLLCYLPKETCLQSQEIPLRLLFWYLDPLILKHDVMQILQESVKRPFLCLNTELYERVEWRSTVICLAISPAIFVETRDLLHNWFLLTGLASVLELQVELVSLVLDIVFRPNQWGISNEVSFKLPFSPAYFPYSHQLLRVLAGPLTCEGFLELVHCINNSIPQEAAGRCSSYQATTKIVMVDHKSMWAMVMNFPNWFYYACLILFNSKSFQDGPPSTNSPWAVEIHKLQDNGALCSDSARYIAWILHPIAKSNQDNLAENLTKIAGSFTSKHNGSDKHSRTATCFNPRLKKSKVIDEVDEFLKHYDIQILRNWLKEFRDLYILYSNCTVNSLYEAKTSQLIGLRQNVLFRRILSGILIAYSHQTTDDGYELLLHYAATGTIFDSTKIQTAGLRHKKRNIDQQEHETTWTENCTRKEAEKGARLVFNLTDVTENLSATLFDTEESEVDFICRVKSRAGKYLLKCVRRLLYLKFHEDDVLMLSDLHDRLIKWKHQGKDDFQGYKDLDDTIDIISKTLSSM